VQQLRVFVAVVEEGSFSAAARRLLRAQSAVSYSIGNLERLLDVQLFERGGRRPRLTPEGETLYREARSVVLQIGRFRARAGRLAAGVEPVVDLAVDPRFPVDVLARAVDELVDRYPALTVTLRTVPSGEVAKLVATGVSALGIGGRLRPSAPAGLEQQALAQVPTEVVAAASHPLVASTEAPTFERLGQHLQLVLVGHDETPEAPADGVPGGRICQLTDARTRAAFLRAGLGWAHVPSHEAVGGLVRGETDSVRPEDWPYGRSVPLFVIHRRVDPPGIATRELVQRLAELAGDGDASIDLDTRVGA